MEDMSVQDMKIKMNKITDKHQEDATDGRREPGGGKTTMIMLDKQGQQLRNAEVNMDEIKANVKTTERNLNEMSKCCGWCLCPCNRQKSIKTNQRYKQVRGTEKSGEGVVSSQVTRGNTQGVTVQSTASSGPYIKRITNDAQEQELEENLEQVSSIIGNLKNMAIDINNELDTQNKTIDRITDKVEKSTDRVVAATNKAKRIIKE